MLIEPYLNELSDKLLEQPERDNAGLADWFAHRAPRPMSMMNSGQQKGVMSAE